jgi:hypothetical protein
MTEYEQARQEWIERGRQQVFAGVFEPLNHKDQLDLMRYWQQQRERVERSGSCETRCRCELVENPQGELVCPHTWRRCPGKALVNIVSRWEKVNA